MTNIDKCYAMLELEALRLWTDTKDRASANELGARLRKYTEGYGELQKEEYEERVKATRGTC